MRMAGLYGNGELVNGGIGIDPGGWYNMPTPGNIYWIYMAAAKNKYRCIKFCCEYGRIARANQQGHINNINPIGLLNLINSSK